MRNSGSKKPYTPSQQLLHLKNNPVCLGTGAVKCGQLTWTYEAQSNPLGRVYTVEIRMSSDHSPDVFVKDPDLDALVEGREIPHIYHNPTRLCLYLPKGNEWHPHLRIDQTIVPWTSLWLFYFEEWLASGEWKGGGVHPDGESSAGNRATRRLQARFGATLR